MMSYQQMLTVTIIPNLESVSHLSSNANLSMVIANGDEYQSIIDTTSVNKDDLFTSIIFKSKENIRGKKQRRKLQQVAK